MKENDRIMKTRILTALLSLTLAMPATTVHLAQKTVRADADMVRSDTDEDVQIAIDETNFPDEGFRKLILKWVDKAEPKGFLTADEIAATTSLYDDNEVIMNLKGIEFFTELEFIDFSSSFVKQADLTKNSKLKSISMEDNQNQFSLNCAGLSELQEVYLDDSEVTSVNLTDCDSLNLVSLNNCDQITDLAFPGCISLGRLECYDCDYLRRLDLSGCIFLQELDCHGADTLVELDLSGCKQLKDVKCQECAIRDLTLGDQPELVCLDCSLNELESLDISNCPKLETLYCFSNQLAELNADHNPLLHKLFCFDNQISELKIYPNHLLLKLVSLYQDPTVKQFGFGSIKEYYYYAGEVETITLRPYDAELGIDMDTTLITEAPKHSIVVTTDGHGTAYASSSNAPEYSELYLYARANDGYRFEEWQFISGDATITFYEVDGAEVFIMLMGATDVELKAIFEPIPRTITVTSDGRGTATASLTSGPVGTTVELTATPNEGYVFNEWQVVSGGVTIADAKSANTSFVIGDLDVEIKATFREPTFEDFVERLYVVALGRPSEAEGKAYWVDQVVNKGYTGADCARFFMLGAPEFLGRGLTDDQFVEVLYKTYFNRDSEADGKAYWLGRLASGTERAVLVEEFIESVEWCNVCSMYGVKSGAKYHKATVPSKNAVKFATRLYTCCLGRDPEAEGLEYWALALTNLDATGYQAASCFFTLPEFVGLQTTNEEYLTRLYKTFMGREPEAEGFAYWLGLLNGGTDRVEVMKAFACCQEFQKICNQYGIVRGEI